MAPSRQGRRRSSYPETPRRPPLNNVIQGGTVRIVPEPANPCDVALDQQRRSRDGKDSEEDRARTQARPGARCRRAEVRSRLRGKEDRPLGRGGEKGREEGRQLPQ